MDATRAELPGRATNVAAPAPPRRNVRTLGLFPALGIFIALMLGLSVRAVFRRAGVYAYVDGRAIEKPMVDLAKEMILHRSGETQPTPVEERSYLLIALDQAIERDLFAQEALRRGFTADEKTKAAHRRQILAHIEAWQPVDQVLATLHVSDQAIEAEITRDVLQQKLKEAISKEVPVPTVEEARRYYDQNIEKFKEEEGTRVLEIVIGKSDSPQAQAEARSRTETILARAQAGEEFQHLAAETSEGPSRRAGGDLGFVKKGFLPPPMEAVVDRLADGEISGIVETRDAFHILKVVARRRYGYTPFAELKDAIISRIATTDFERRVSELHHRLRANARIVRYDSTPASS